MTHLVGITKAKKLYFLSNPLSADEAYRLGIIDRIFPDESFHADAQVLVKRIAHGPTSAIRLMKKNINTAAVSDLATTLDLEAEHMIRSCRLTMPKKLSKPLWTSDNLSFKATKALTQAALCIAPRAQVQQRLVSYTQAVLCIAPRAGSLNE